MPKFKLRHLYREHWIVSAIVRYLSDHHGVDVDWSTVKNVISKYKSGVLFDDAGDENSFTKFRKVTDNDISTVRSSLAENRAMTSTDLQRRLADTGTSISKATVYLI